MTTQGSVIQPGILVVDNYGMAGCAGSDTRQAREAFDLTCHKDFFVGSLIPTIKLKKNPCTFMVIYRYKDVNAIYYRDRAKEEFHKLTAKKPFDVNITAKSIVLSPPGYCIEYSVACNCRKQNFNYGKTQPKKGVILFRIEETLQIPEERRPVLKIFHEYFECREIKPRFRKLNDLLQLTRYSGPENEYCIDKRLLLTYQQLIDTIQCSRVEFANGLKQYSVIEVDGRMRILDYEYEYRILSLMLALISENSWKLDEIDRDETISALNGIAPDGIIEGLFDAYATKVPGNSDKYQYHEDIAFLNSLCFDALAGSILSYFATPQLSASTLMSKYAREITQNGVRFYVGKHG